METQQKLPCACGEGLLEVKSTIYGKWRVDEVVTACQACGSDDIRKAREVEPSTGSGEPPKS